MSPVYSHLGETLAGISTIKAFDVSENFIRQNEDTVDMFFRCYLNNSCVSNWINIHTELISSLVVFSAALLSVLGRSYITPGMVGLIITYAIDLPPTLRTVFRTMAQIETRMVCVERLWEYAQLPQESNAKTSSPVQDSWPEKGAIKYTSLSAKYANTSDFALKNISLNVNPEEKIGIVGRTGAGKSSMALALFRLMNETSGIISVDNQDINSVTLNVLRSRISIIPQEPFLFSGSMTFNVDPFDEHNPQRVAEALSKTNLDKLANLQVSERGSNLSSGQKQLVCLARALLRRSKVLILDEATAAVDPETDALVQETIRTEFGNATIVTIAHRLDTIMNSDRIVVMDEGRIAEVDSPKRLLADKQSKFFSMMRNSKKK